MTLIEFLEARLAEDEATARAVEDHSAPWDGQWKADGPDAVRTYNDWVLFHGRGRPLAPGLTDHVARHDPARVLAEVEMKRALLRFHAPKEVDGPVMRINGKDQVVLNTNCTSCSDRNPPSWPCATIKLLARPYADHPDHPDAGKP